MINKVNTLSCPFCRDDENLKSQIRAYGREFFELDDEGNVVGNVEGINTPYNRFGIDPEDLTYYCTSCGYETEHVEEFIEDKMYRGYFVSYRDEFCAKVVGKNIEEVLEKFSGNNADYELTGKNKGIEVIGGLHPDFIEIRNAETEEQVF